MIAFLQQVQNHTHLQTHKCIFEIHIAFFPSRRLGSRRSAGKTGIRIIAEQWFARHAPAAIDWSETLHKQGLREGERPPWLMSIQHDAKVQKIDAKVQ